MQCRSRSAASPSAPHLLFATLLGIGAALGWPAPVAAVVYDLAADFSSTSNPTPLWGYNNAIAQGGGPVGPYLAAGWNAPDFGPNQSGWVGNVSGPHAGWAKADQTYNFDPNAGPPGGNNSKDWPLGRIATHGPTSIAWQNFTGADVTVDISGGVWMLRDLNRSTTWNLWKNDSVLLSQSTNPVFRADGNSATPAALAAGSGGCPGISGVTIGQGEYVRLEILGNDFVGVDMRLNTDLTPCGPPPPPPNPNAYYRFEEGSGTNIFDTISGEDDGNLAGSGAFYSSDVPTPVIPRTGAPNLSSLDFTQGGYAHINGHGFIFHQPSVGGAAGDATFEWYMKVPAPAGHSAIFWTNGGPADTNRFNLFWNASFTGAPDSDRFVDGDYRDPNGAGHNVGGPGYNSGNPVSLNEWHHFAIVRRDLGGGSFAWDWYIDGVQSAGHNSTTSDPMPLAVDWLIAGRQGGHAVNALIDEVRLTDRALRPDEFLNVIPEPTTSWLAMIGGGVMAYAVRRFRRRDR